MLDRLKEWITQYIKSVLESTVRVGVVNSTDPKTSTVRVKFDDDDGLISYDLRVLVRKVKKDQDYWMPDIGDHVLCVFLPFGLEQGFVLGSFYSSADTPPVNSQDQAYTKFEDGAVVYYDRKQSLLYISLPGDKQVEIAGNAQLTVQGDVTANIQGNVSAEIGGNLESTVKKDAQLDVLGSLAATAGIEATIDAPLIKHNKGTGVITEESICHFTGNPHGDGSSTVKAGK